MKGFEKFILIIFSILAIIASVTAILISAEMLDTMSLFNQIENVMIQNKVWVVVISAIVTCVSLVGIFANQDDEESTKSGLAIKNESGTVYINKDTFENIILGVARNYASLKNVKVYVNINEQGISANIFAYILPETIVPTLTSKLQEDIKDSILKQTTVEIKEANIKIKGVYIQQEKPVK